MQVLEDTEVEDRGQNRQKKDLQRQLPSPRPFFIFKKLLACLDA